MGKLLSFQRGAMWGRDTSSNKLSPSISPGIPVTFQEIERSSPELLMQAMQLPSPDLILQRFVEGRRCFVACIEDKIASYCWVSKGVEWIGEMEIHFRMGESEAYIWDCLTLPAFRRKGLYSALLQHILDQLGREGTTRIWIGSNLENQPSIKGFENAGFQPIIQVRYFRLLWFKRFWVTAYPSAPKDLLSAARQAFTKEQIQPGQGSP